MKPRTLFLWITPAVIGAFLIGLLTARAMEDRKSPAWWSESIEERVRTLVGEEYVDELPVERQQELFFTAMEAYLTGLDDYCTFYDPEERSRMEVETTGQFGGVGIQLRQEEDLSGLLVTGLRIGDPAEKAGVRIGDKIVAVDGKPIAGLSMDEITGLIKGEPGEKVTLGLVRDGDPLELTMQRSEIKLDSVKGVGILDREHGVGYLHVTSFQENTGDDAREALERLKAAGATSIVLDLRQNRGGILNGAVAVVDLFLDEGVIVRTTGRSPGSRGQFEAREETTVFRDEPLVVLVDGGSASAAEVVAGAFQDHRRGVLVGQRTYGKFLVQSIHRLPELNTAIKLTTARYYTPYGRWLQRRDRDGVRGGLLPDVVVERSEEQEEAIARRFVAEHGIGMRVAEEPNGSFKEDPQLLRAVQILRNYAEFAGEDGK